MSLLCCTCDFALPAKPYTQARIRGMHKSGKGFALGGAKWPALHDVTQCIASSPWYPSNGILPSLHVYEVWITVRWDFLQVYLPANHLLCGRRERRM